jgi:TolB-like protein
MKMSLRKAIPVAIALLILFQGELSYPDSTSLPFDGIGAGIDELVSQISESMAREKKSRIAILDFTNLYGIPTPFGRYLAEELITRLHKTGEFRIVERHLLNKIVTEQDFGLTQLADLGADAVITGTISDLVDRLRVNARLISTTTGDIFAVASCSVPKGEALRIMEAKPVATRPRPVNLQSENLPVNLQSENLVVNGDFEQDLTIGWSKVIDWDPARVNEAGVNWARVEEELFDSKNVLHLYHKGISQISLVQEIPVTTTNLEFSVSLKLYASKHDRSGAFFWLEFQDNTGRVVGDLWWRAWDYGWKRLKDSPIRRVVVQECNDGGVDTKWRTYRINLRDELSTYMIGVEREKVKKIVIKMLCKGERYGSAHSELWVDNIVLREIK